jgi:hypothetical protein
MAVATVAIIPPVFLSIFLPPLSLKGYALMEVQSTL